MSKKIVLSIGQCGFDSGNIGRVISSAGADCLHVATKSEAFKMLESEPVDYILVNRIFDATGDSGLAFIQECKEKYPDKNISLVSNFADAQQEAEALGAVPGFGKNALGKSQTLELIKKHL